VRNFAGEFLKAGSLGQRIRFQWSCARAFFVGKVPDISLCDTAGIATDRPPVYGKRQGITQPASASNIPIPRVNPAQRCGARCVADDSSRRTSERSSDHYHHLIEAHSTGMLCSIFLLDEDGLRLRYGVAASLPEAYRAASDGICIAPNVGSCGTAAYLRQPVFVSDIASDARWVKFRHFALQNGLRAAWSTPLMSHNCDVLGTFCMYYREVRHPGPAEFQLIDYASRIAGIAIERDRSQTALTRAFEQIEKSEAQLRHIVDAIPQMIAVLNPDGTVLCMNQTMLDYTGLTTKEVMPTEVRDRAFNPEDVARFRGERLESLSRDVPFQNEKRILRKDGQYRWFLIHYNPLLDDQGRVIRWYATGTDITDDEA
jgi:PAS domain S-box-containing protein